MKMSGTIKKVRKLNISNIEKGRKMKFGSSKKVENILTIRKCWKLNYWKLSYVLKIEKWSKIEKYRKLRNVEMMKVLVKIENIWIFQNYVCVLWIVKTLDFEKNGNLDDWKNKITVLLKINRTKKG